MGGKKPPAARQAAVQGREQKEEIRRKQSEAFGVIL